VTVLSAKQLPHHGPYVVFVDCPQRFDVAESGWPNRSIYESNIFFELADNLIGTLCSLTHSYIFFDPNESSQLDHPHEIRKLASEFLLWASQLARCRPHDFYNELSIYIEPPTSPVCESLTADIFQRDLIETLLFIVSRLNEIAHQKRCLLIVGI